MMTVADKLIPAIAPLIEKITGVITSVSGWMEKNPHLWICRCGLRITSRIQARTNFLPYSGLTNTLMRTTRIRISKKCENGAQMTQIEQIFTDKYLKMNEDYFNKTLFYMY